MPSLLDNPFPPSDKPAWLAQVQRELKDPAAAETLRWHTGEGFIAEPYYTASDQPPAWVLETAGQQQKQVPGWLNAPAYACTDDARADNDRLRNALTRGADALVLSDSGRPGETSDAAVGRLARLLNNIKLSDTPVFFRPDPADVTVFVSALKTVAPYQLRGGLLTDAGAQTADATRQTANSPHFRTICASSHAFHNAGATATQELAFLLAKLTDAYDGLTDTGLTMGQLIPKTILSVSVGTSYFMEIAKLRALRVLFGHWLRHYPANPDQNNPLSPLPFIHTQTSAFYDAATTPYTNLLRATTEAMAAVVGGCDALTVRPYDAVLGQPQNTEFSDRVARNISVLLGAESYFDKVADPSAGSYYIETLTQRLSQSAWTLFLDVEQRGGFVKATQTGFIAGEIERAYRAKVDAVQQGRVLVGVTKFRHDETVFEKPIMNKTTENQAGSLPNRRLAEEFEG